MTSRFSLDIEAVDHVGIRVSDLPAALNFYQMLGFIIDKGECYPEYNSTGLINKHGVRLNLIDTAEPTDNSQLNILFDEDIKYPGLTHIAFIVSNLQETIQFFEHLNISITEGPILLKRRQAIFIRDPDGNVIEFNQLL
jgi:catechol 2,3-dioxygenase-like lactoylglutathione lyase family enzyme